MKTRIWVLVGLLMTLTSVTARNGGSNTIPLIGSAAPSFTAETTDGKLLFPGDFGNSWKILFSHPKDFTPVCTTEIMELALLQDKLEALDVKVAVISTDTRERHLLWKKAMEEMLYSSSKPVRIRFPLIDDSEARVSRLYGMLHEPVSTTENVRGVFIINPSNIVEATLFYPSAVGRNMNEIIRTVEALQTAASTQLLTPVNWQPGGDLLVPHFPYTREEVSGNPEIARDYYRKGALLWYKKAAGTANNRVP